MIHGSSPLSSQCTSPRRRQYTTSQPTRVSVGVTAVYIATVPKSAKVGSLEHSSWSSSPVALLSIWDPLASPGDVNKCAHNGGARDHLYAVDRRAP